MIQTGRQNENGSDCCEPNGKALRKVVFIVTWFRSVLDSDGHVKNTKWQNDKITLWVRVGCLEN